MSSEPRVSILMNCYNGERYLREAVESVLAQTYRNWELVFWDNRSTDDSAEIFRSYADPRLKYLLAPRHTTLGQARANAWPHLNGELVAVLDADDVWLPEKLERQIPLFADPEVGIVISDTLFFNGPREKPLYGGKYPPTGWVFADLFTGYFVSFETVVIRRAIAERLPRAFDPDFSSTADYDLIVRLSRISKLAIYPGVLAKWRVHAGSDTWRRQEAFAEEKERWLAKQVAEDPSFARDFAPLIRRARNRMLRLKATNALMNNRRQAAIKLVLEQDGFDHWHAWALLLLCLLPLSGAAIAFRQKRKFELAWA